MPFFTSQQRRRWRGRQTASRLKRLGEVPAECTQQRLGKVIAVMLTPKPDPTRGTTLKGQSLDYMRPWWNTINRVGLSGTVLHDGLPADVIDMATTECIDFHRVVPSHLHVFHDRHRLVREYLEQTDDRWVFITDISDVAFKRDPFVLVQQDAGQHRLFIGSEAKTIGQCRCLRQEMIEQFGELLHADRQVVNPGILGGSREEVIEVLDAVLHCTAQFSGRLINSDMPIVNKVVHDRYRPDELFTAFPLHSEFKKWQYGTRAAILHK